MTYEMNSTQRQAALYFIVYRYIGKAGCRGHFSSASMCFLILCQSKPHIVIDIYSPASKLRCIYPRIVKSYHEFICTPDGHDN